MLSELIDHKKDHDAENSDPGLGRTQQCVGVKPVNGISVLLLDIKL